MMFTSAFAISSVLNMAFVIGLVFCAFWGKKGVLKEIKMVEPQFLFMFWIVLIIGYVFMAKGEKCTNHLFMWTYPMIAYYFVFKNIVASTFSHKEVKDKVFGAIAVAVVFASCYTVFEYIAINYLGIDLSFIPRGRVQEMDAVGLWDNTRARCFMEEPTQYAFYFLILSPMSIYWICSHIKSNIIRFILVLVQLASLFVTFSASGFFIILVGFGLFVFFYLKENTVSGITVIKRLLLVAALISLFYIFFPQIFNGIGSIISTKLDSDNTSNADRMSRFDALEYFTGPAILIGYGPAAFSTLHTQSFVSFLLGCLMNTGILGSICFALFMLRRLKYALEIEDPWLSHTLFIAIIMTSLDLIIGDMIYVPWMWLLLSMVDVLYYKEQYEDIESDDNDDEVIDDNYTD